MVGPSFSQEYVLQPMWNSVNAQVMEGFRDKESSSPSWHISIPAGVWLVRVDNESRFSVTPRLIRNDNYHNQKQIRGRGSGGFQIQTENTAEMLFKIEGGPPNTNDQAISRIGVTLTRMGGFK